MDAELKAAPEFQCGAPGHCADEDYRCQREVGHQGDHAAEPGPGETVMWPWPPVAEPDEPQPRFSGLLGPWGIACTPEQQQEEQARLALGLARVAAEDLRSQRYEAVELAIRALRPVAGAYDLPGCGASGTRADYADAIIELAERLGTYIQNGV